MSDAHLSQEQQQAVKVALGCTDKVKCPHCVEVGGGMDGERYRCARCGDGYYLDYEEMR